MRETVTTDMGLESLPAGSIVRSNVGTIACRYDGRLGVVFGDERPFPWHKIALPAVVLYRPDTEPPAALSILWPPDEATVEKVARTLHGLGHPDGCYCGDIGWEAWASDARAVLEGFKDDGDTLNISMEQGE